MNLTPGKINLERFPKHAIIHTYPDWLPLTANWIHTTIINIEGFKQGVLTEERQNTKYFQVPNLLDLSQTFPWRYRWEFLLRKFRLYQQLPLFEKILREASPLLLHSHFANFAWRDSAVTKALNIPQVVSVYGADVSMLPSSFPKWDKRIRTLFSSVQAVICEGPAMAEKVKKLGAASEKVWTIPLGIDFQNLVYVPRSWNKKEPLKVLIAASFREKKGIPDALRALSAISRNLSIEISVVGDATNDAKSQREKQNILEVVKQENLDGITKFYGYKDHAELIKIASQSHLFVQASKKASDGDDEGGAPVALIEMAASGLPIVATKHCDIDQIVIDKITGFLADEGSAKSIESAIWKWIEHEGNWKNMLDTSRKHVEEIFNVQKQSKAIQELYRMILK